MSIRVERRGNKTTVETDYYDSFGTEHSEVYKDVELLSGMKNCGIDKIEINGIGDATCVSKAIHDEFDRQYKEKTGSSQGYFSPL